MPQLVASNPPAATALIALDRECLHRLRKNPVEFVRMLQWALMETGDPGYAKDRLRINYGVTLPEGRICDPAQCPWRPTFPEDDECTTDALSSSPSPASPSAS